MKIFCSLVFTFFFVQKICGQSLLFPDSLKAIGFYTELNMPKKASSNSIVFGKNIVTFNFTSKKTYTFVYNPTATATIRNTDGQFKKRNGSIDYVVDLPTSFPKDKIKILITQVKDSATTHIAFYTILDTSNQWKYIGKFITSDSVHPNFFSLQKKKKDKTSNLQNTWIQYERKGWLAADSTIDKVAPKFRPFRNIDSTAQAVLEQQVLQDSLQHIATPYNGLYYTMLKQGNGEFVKVTDTVVIHYKGWNFSNGLSFDETKQDPATFPLQRLIPGWQIGLPLCRVGGKIRLYIPSGLAYGIRNVATTIPPNSILVFDIEVLSVKR